MSEREQLLHQVDRLTGSAVLHGSESLCKLLRYLAKQALEHPGVPVKEYQIATEVFGRPADFDPQSDSAIRVQAGRLRSKLSEYYASEGVGDPVLVELPKGTYALSFHPRVNGNGKRSPSDTQHFVSESVSSTAARRTIAQVALTVLLTAATILGAQWFMFRRTLPTATSNDVDSVPASLQTFWKPFMTGPEEPYVVFSNAAFVGRPETGIRYFNPAKDAHERIWDHYTGVGEVLAVHSLDRTFAQLHRRLRVKRGSLLSMDDASNNDLIFVGSPSENLTLADLPSTKEFVFQRSASGARKGDLAIVNVHPQAGEAIEFLASPSGDPLTDDYAIISLMPGINPARSVMILAGTTTFGTQAAVEFLGHPAAVQELLSKLGATDTQKMPPFEALLHIKITRGVPLEAELVAVRKR